MNKAPDIAVLLPCYNEEKAIRKVITDFHKAIPYAVIYVYDNNSNDKTVEISKSAGAIVRSETLQGKGNVVRRMFADIEADIYILADGDDTYDSSIAPEMIKQLLAGPHDMITATRKSDDADAYRLGHRFGNRLMTKIVTSCFGKRIDDMLSGYRAFSRRFVKSFPALSRGFEIESELTIHALELRMPIIDITSTYKSRLKGSHSKLNTFRDGFKILWTIMILLKEERPLQFFAVISALLATTSLILAWPIFLTYLQTGLVPRFPTAILATGLMLLAFLGAASGLILDTVTRGRRESKRMHYLSIPAPAFDYNAINN